MNKEFDNYVNNFDLGNKDIKLKYNHSYRVMKLSKKYAEKLGFSNEEIELATLIGLLHDIGRFKQLKNYNTYSDSKKIDHADYGSYLLFDKGLIKKFWNKVEDYNIIKLAIENHNKLEIPNITDEKIMKFVKLIRDVDKLDIIYLYGYLNEFDLKESNEEINESIVNDIKNHKIAKRVDRENNNEIALTFAYAFDINNDIILEELKKNYKYFYNQINNNGKFKDIYIEVNKYIDERIDNYVRN